MDTQIKEEAKEPSLCFETSDDNLASLTLIEKYDRFLENHDSDVESDDDDFIRGSNLRKELFSFDFGPTEAADYTLNSRNPRLSTGLSSKYKNSNEHVVVADEDSTNGTAGEEKETRTVNDQITPVTPRLAELIEKLNSITKLDEWSDKCLKFCTEAELEETQETFGEVLDYIRVKSVNFERRSCSKNSESPHPNDQDDEVLNDTLEKSADYKLLSDKIELVQKARDKFYEIEQQVSEQLDQLELVERYKMESVG